MGCWIYWCPNLLVWHLDRVVKMGRFSRFFQLRGQLKINDTVIDNVGLRSFIDFVFGCACKLGG